MVVALAFQRFRNGRHLNQMIFIHSICVLKSSSCISQPQKSTIRNALFRFHQTNTLNGIDLFKYSECLGLCLSVKKVNTAVFNQDATFGRQLEDKYRWSRPRHKQTQWTSSIWWTSGPTRPWGVRPCSVGRPITLTLYRRRPWGQSKTPKPSESYGRKCFYGLKNTR